MEQVKYRPEYTREEYRTLRRNPIIIASYATDYINVGGIVRSAESFLTEEVWSIVRPSQATACGAMFWQPWEQIAEEDMGYFIELSLPKYTIVSLEITDESKNLYDVSLPKNMLLVVGNESYGIPKDVLSLTSLSGGMAVQIPLEGFTGSLNVASATTVALYEWSRQWRKH
jgi:tRNA G18 (ribose-2'-O)-methylase SpoU